MLDDISIPPPPAPVNANSDVMLVKMAPTVASNALPPSIKISFAVFKVSFEPAAIEPYFILIFSSINCITFC